MKKLLNPQKFVLNLQTGDVEEVSVRREQEDRRAALSKLRKAGLFAREFQERLMGGIPFPGPTDCEVFTDTFKIDLRETRFACWDAAPANGFPEASGRASSLEAAAQDIIALYRERGSFMDPENDCESDLKTLFQEFEKVVTKHQLTAVVCIGKSIDPPLRPVIYLKLFGPIDDRTVVVGGVASGAIENMCASSPPPLDHLATWKRAQFIGFQIAADLLERGHYTLDPPPQAQEPKP